MLVTMKGCHDNKAEASGRNWCEMLLVAGTSVVSGEELDGVRVWIYFLKVEPKGFSGPPFMKCE